MPGAPFKPCPPTVTSYTLRGVDHDGAIYKDEFPDFFSGWQTIMVAVRDVPARLTRLTLCEEYSDGSVCDLLVYDAHGVWPDKPRIE